MKPTIQQQAFLDEIRDGNGHIALKARAGCGKTSTIKMGIAIITEHFPGSETIVCAFNKAIADEIKVDLEAAGYNWRKVGAQTLHGMGFGLVRFAFKNPKVDDKKVLRLIDQINEPEIEPLRAAVAQLVRLAKQEGFGFFGDRQIGDRGAWYEMADHYNINGFEDTTMMDTCVRFAARVYKASLNQTDIIDFDDMILFPLIKSLRVKFAKDFLFVDEAQDLSRTRQALARKFVKRGGRMIIVGDDRQAIYGFSGADADALTNLQEALQAKEMPLSVTWRCPKAVVELAQKLVPDIEAAESAPEGEVAAIVELPEGLDHSTAILCRNTAPLIEQAYNLIRKGTPCKVEGRDIGQGLKTLIKRWKVKTIDAFLNKLDLYQDREVQKALAKGKEDKAEAVVDKCDTLRVIAKECLRQDKKTVSDMEAFIDNLFADGATDCTILATYHRSKGREWKRVILMDHYQLCPSKWAQRDWQIAQEDNLAYVAFTRAQEQLLFLR